jgi:histidinol-phosphatase
MCDQPAHGRRYWATRGGGAFVAQPASGAAAKLSVTGARELSSARSYVPPSEFQPNARARQVAALVSGATRQQPHEDHPALQVATGGFELAIWLRAGPWDLAAPALIVEEAGGRFTNIDGRSDFTTGTALFSNGHLHEAVLALIQRSGGQ